MGRPVPPLAKVSHVLVNTHCPSAKPTEELDAGAGHALTWILREMVMAACPKPLALSRAKSPDGRVTAVNACLAGVREFGLQRTRSSSRQLESYKTERSGNGDSRPAMAQRPAAGRFVPTLLRHRSRGSAMRRQHIGIQKVRSSDGVTRGVKPTPKPPLAEPSRSYL